MSTAYSGNSAAITAHLAVGITVPADGDALNALSVNTALKKLADIEQWLQERAALNNGYANTATTTNGPGLTGVGLGHGQGVSGTGGATADPGGHAGPGVEGTGGAAAGPGVRGFAGDGGWGGDFFGTSGTGGGARFSAHPAGTGIEVYGGVNSSVGSVARFSHAGSNVGVHVDASGATGGSGVGLKVTGNGSADALWVAGGAATAVFIEKASSANAALLINPNGNANTDHAIEVVGGSILFDGAATSSVTGYTNQLVAANISKSWGFVALGGGAPSVTSGFNIASVALQGAVGSRLLRVTFAAAMANANYVVTFTQHGTSLPWLFAVQTQTTTYFDMYLQSIAGGGTQLDVGVTSGNVGFLVAGLQ